MAAVLQRRLGQQYSVSKHAGHSLEDDPVQKWTLCRGVVSGPTGVVWAAQSVTALNTYGRAGSFQNGRRLAEKPAVPGPPASREPLPAYPRPQPSRALCHVTSPAPATSRRAPAGSRSSIPPTGTRLQRSRDFACSGSRQWNTVDARVRRGVSNRSRYPPVSRHRLKSTSYVLLGKVTVYEKPVAINLRS